MAGFPAFDPLPEMDHLVSQGSLRFAFSGAVTERPGDGDLEGVGHEVTIPPAHAAAEAERNFREPPAEIGMVHMGEFSAQAFKARLVARQGARWTAADGSGAGSGRRNRLLKKCPDIAFRPRPCLCGAGEEERRERFVHIGRRGHEYFMQP